MTEPPAEIPDIPPGMEIEKIEIDEVDLSSHPGARLRSEFTKTVAEALEPLPVDVVVLFDSLLVTPESGASTSETARISEHQHNLHVELMRPCRIEVSGGISCDLDTPTPVGWILPAVGAHDPEVVETMETIFESQMVQLRALLCFLWGLDCPDDLAVETEFTDALCEILVETGASSAWLPAFGGVFFYSSLGHEKFLCRISYSNLMYTVEIAYKWSVPMAWVFTSRIGEAEEAEGESGSFWKKEARDLLHFVQRMIAL